MSRFEDIVAQEPTILPSSQPLPLVNASASGPVPSLCSTNIIPLCLQALYNIPTTPATQPSNTAGVAGFMNEFALHSDARLFWQTFRPDVPATFDFAVQSVDNGTNPQNQFSGIPVVDIEYIGSVAAGVPITFFTVGPNNVDGLSGHIDLLNAVVQQATPPTVLSSSITTLNEADVSEDMYM